MWVLIILSISHSCLTAYFSFLHQAACCFKINQPSVITVFWALSNFITLWLWHSQGPGRLCSLYCLPLLCTSCFASVSQTIVFVLYFHPCFLLICVEKENKTSIVEWELDVKHPSQTVHAGRTADWKCQVKEIERKVC